VTLPEGSPTNQRRTKSRQKTKQMLRRMPTTQPPPHRRNRLRARPPRPRRRASGPSTRVRHLVWALPGESKNVVPSSRGREGVRSVRLDPVTASGVVCWAAYREIVQSARRFVGSEDEARDLVQDALMIALHRGFDDWWSPARRPWLRGVLRKRAAFVARSDRRRHDREQVAVESDGRGLVVWIWRPSFLAGLPPSLRAVATLASADLCSAEIRWLLELNGAALRSRLSALRRAVRAEAESPTLPAPEPLVSLGGRRALLLAGLKRLHGRAVATHDPDGHTILFRVAPHKTGLRGNS
jgi:DNA-directed RNA polymerase specialized sigma24 family protein